MKQKPRIKLGLAGNKNRESHSFFRIPQEIFALLEENEMVYLSHKDKVMVLLSGKKALAYVNKNPQDADIVTLKKSILDLKIMALSMRGADTLRNAEIDNLRTILHIASECNDIPLAAEQVQVVRTRLHHLAEDPTSAGRHDHLTGTDKMKKS